MVRKGKGTNFEGVKLGVFLTSVGSLLLMEWLYMYIMFLCMYIHRVVYKHVGTCLLAQGLNTNLNTIQWF